MPINFEQPDPMGYSALAGVPGQVAQGNLDRQYQMQMMQMGLEAGKAARPDYASAAATGNANAQRATQAALQGQQEDSAQQMQLQGLAAQQGMQSQQIAASQQREADQFTFQDSVRLAQMQNALSSIDNNSDLSPEEKADYKMQLRTGIDPMVQRQQAAKTKQLQQQEEDGIRQSAVQAANVSFYNSAIAKGQPPEQRLSDNSILLYESDGKGGIKTTHIKAADVGDPNGLDGLAGGGSSSGTKSHAGSGAMGSGEFSGMSKYDTTAALEKYLPHFKNDVGTVDPAAAKKFVADEEQEHLAKFQQAENDGATRWLGMFQQKYPDPTKAPAVYQAKRDRAIDTIVSQPLPDNETGVRKQADLLNSLYPAGSPVPPAAWRRAQEIRNMLKNNQTSEGQRRSNVPEALGGSQTPPAAQAAAAQQPWKAGAENLRAKGYAGGQFTGTDGRDYILHKDGNVSLVPNSTENLQAGVTEFGERFKRGLGVVNQDALDIRELLHKKLGTTGYGG